MGKNIEFKYGTDPNQQLPAPPNFGSNRLQIKQVKMLMWAERLMQYVAKQSAYQYDKIRLLLR